MGQRRQIAEAAGDLDIKAKGSRRRGNSLYRRGPYPITLLFAVGLIPKNSLREGASGR
jgi:hypothetical protein